MSLSEAAQQLADEATIDPDDPFLPASYDEAAYLVLAQTVLEQERPDVLEDLTPWERRIIFQWASHLFADGDVTNQVHDVIWEMDYERKPVSIDTFVEDTYYLGRNCSDLHEKWRRDLSEVHKPGNTIVEWLFCLAGDTRVPLLDGTEATLEELHRRKKTPFWVYSIDPHGQVVPGKCTKVTKFAKDQLYKVTLDDGSTLRANADHELVCRDGVKRKLKDLRPGDRLMPFTTREHGPRLKGYEQVYIPGAQKYAYTHRVTGRYVAGGECPKTVDGDRAVAHHVNFDKRDNTPENIRWMAWASHRELHYRAGSEGKSPEHLDAIRRRQSKACKNPDSAIRRGHRRFMQSAKGRALSRRNLAKANLTSDDMRERGARGLTTRWADPAQRAAAAARCRDRSTGNTWGSQNKDDSVSVADLYAAYEQLQSLSEVYASLGVSRNRAVRILRDAGLTIADLKSGYRNHKIVSIELDVRDHVYCLTVPEWGNFAICTGEGRQGIFSGNTGAIGSGKTTVAAVELAYRLYMLSCLRDPASYYGLLPGSPIVFGLYSITKVQAADTGYLNLRAYIDQSPYFQEVFPPDPKLETKADFFKTTGKRIEIISGSRSLHAIGRNLFAMLMDEANFMQAKQDKDTGKKVGQAYELYNSVRRRIKSRFLRPGGVVPGIMLLSSSRTVETAFIEERLDAIKAGKEADADDPEVAKLKLKTPTAYVSDYTQWDCKPAHRFVMPRFRVDCGDRFHPPKLLDKGEKAREDARVIDVPGEFKGDFVEDIDQALRDIAGVATDNLAPFIRDRKSVLEAKDDRLVHPFTRETISISTEASTHIDEYFDLKAVCRVKKSRYVPRLNPERPRYIHVDLALTGDAAGIAMGHVSGLVRDRLRRPDGTEVMDVFPYIVMDFMLRIYPPVAGEIDLGKIRTFILYLKQFYNVEMVTFDGFQSADSRQILAKLGVRTKQLSLDKSEDGYMSLRAALSGRRIRYYHYAPFQQEVLDLQRIFKPGGLKAKVDHPETGSDKQKGRKDVADAVAGVVSNCVSDPNASLGLVPPSATDVEVRDPREVQTAAPATREVGGAGVDFAKIRAALQHQQKAG